MSPDNFGCPDLGGCGSSWLVVGKGQGCRGQTLVMKKDLAHTVRCAEGEKLFLKPTSIFESHAQT